MKEKTISIHNLTIGYRRKRELNVVGKGINAVINSGELTCLLGVNGAGKTTLLRTLSAFLPPIGGDVDIMGRPLGSYTDRQLSKLIGVVLTERFSLRNMTVDELVGMGRSPYTGFWGSLGKKDRLIVDEALALVKIGELRTRMVHTLSDGERQKVMIAKALAQQTPIIFLDEPTAFLDFPSKVDTMQLLHKLAGKMNKAIFLSTHDLELALQIADKVWLMDKGNGIICGTPEDLAIDGTLSHFFSQEGITFDLDTGLFRIDNEFWRQLKIIGHGSRYSMVKKALQRLGVLAGRDVQSDLFIDVGDKNTPKFVVHPVGKEPIEVMNIEEMLGVVKNQLKL